MLAEYSFRPRGWALALTAAAVAAGTLLGNWQLHRADEKHALAARLDAAALAAPRAVPQSLAAPAQYALSRVEARGVFLEAHTVLLDNKLRGGRVGYEVLTPLALGSGLHVVVNRGWIPAPASREVLPEIHTPSGEQTIEGFALERLPRRFNPGGRGAAGKVRQEVELAGFAAETGLALQPFFIEQHSTADDGLLRDWPRPQSGSQKHEMYALQWYSLAVLSVILLVVLSLHRDQPAPK